MTEMDEQGVRDFAEKMARWQLPLASEQKLLDAILLVAADIQEKGVEPQAFVAEFATAFTKKKADLVLGYVDARRAEAADAGVTYPATHPAMIIKNPVAIPPLDHDD